MLMHASPRKFQDTFAGDSRMAHLMRCYDWDSSPMGPVANWPQSLKTMIRVMLTSNHPMWIAWGQRMTMFHNDAYVPILGNRHPIALGKSAQETWPEVWHLIGLMLEAALREEKATSCIDQLLILERNGYREEVYLSFSYGPIPDDNGDVGGIFCTCLESSDKVVKDRRLQTLADLADSITRPESIPSIIEAAFKVLAGDGRDLPCALYVPSLHGQSLWDDAVSYGIRNKIAFCKDLSLKVPESEEGRPLTFHTLDQILNFESEVENFDCPRDAFLFPISNRDHSDQIGSLLFALNPLRPIDDDYVRFCKLVVNQIEAALNTCRIQEGLWKGAEELIRKDLEKTDFIAKVSQEFRTPLTFMLGPLQEIIQEERADSTTREMLAIVQNNCVRLLKLVNQLLDASRLEAGTLPCRLEATNLSELTTELAANFRSAIEHAGIRFSVECEDLLQPVFVDRNMWEKIVFNLLTNALKFTSRGEISLTLSTVDGSVMLKVRDTGIGIPPAELPEIFHRYYRSQFNPTSFHQGNGMDLALTSDLVKLHQGQIFATNNANRGSEFAVVLPFGKSEDLASRQPDLREGGDTRLTENTTWNRSAAEPKFSEILTKSLRVEKELILIVEDDRDMRAYLKHLLQKNYSLLFACNGREALTILADRKPDLIISDVMMPEIDGFQLLKTIREDERLKTVSFLILSALADRANAARALAEGADDYIIKPFGSKELLSKVASEIKLSAMRSVAAQQEAHLNAEQEAADLSNRLKDEFLSVVAHELKTPLNGIYGIVQILSAAGTDGKDLRKYLDFIESAVQTEIEVVEDMIAISEMIFERVHFDFKRINLVEALNNAISKVKSEHVDGLYTIQVGEMAEGVMIRGDSHRVEQAIEKILDNAIKFSDGNGRIDITISTENSHALLKIKDNGCGISKDFLPYAFDSFRQEDGSPCKKYGGLGIGLSLAKQIVIAHGGDIQLNSEGEGKGVDCILRFPMFKMESKTKWDQVGNKVIRHAFPT